MIGGAELEPRSKFFHPEGRSISEVNAAVQERERLAAQHRLHAKNPQQLASEAARRNELRHEVIGNERCRKHEAPVFGTQPPAPPDCRACKAAQTRKSKDPAWAQEVTPAHVQADDHSMADYFDDTARVLRDHLHARTAPLN